MIPSLFIPNVLFQGKNLVSLNVWPGGELIHGDRSRAWLHDNKIVSACSYVCVCPTGAASERQGCWGRKAMAGGCCFSICLDLGFGAGVGWGDAQATKNEKYPLVVELVTCARRCWCRWGSCCFLVPSLSCLVRMYDEGNSSLSGVKGGMGLSLEKGYTAYLSAAPCVLLSSCLVQEGSRCQRDLKLVHSEGPKVMLMIRDSALLTPIGSCPGGLLALITGRQLKEPGFRDVVVVQLINLV